MAQRVTRQNVQSDRWEYERPFWDRGLQCVAGVDEVGRGPLAGPVVAVAVILPQDFDGTGITDSKLLSAAQRIDLYPNICEKALSWGVGLVDAAGIDSQNILQASYTAMRLALDELPVKAEAVLVDGKFRIPNLDIPQRAIVDGDELCLSIGAASIIAKEIRDRIMEDYDRQFPEYGFVRHKGYATPEHRAALSRLGPSPIHRKSFTPVRNWQQNRLDI
ncbi:MAG: ribonuclease HII [candidate division Zixibacteria bacterium]|nr:ribonuclease HII [candidate division Zixibacteria bacterium]